MKLKAIRNKILVHNMERGERMTPGGIILRNDDGTADGVRPRWAQVYAVGPDVKDSEISPGKWVLIEHGRWTRGICMVEEGKEHVYFGVEWPDSVLMVADECPVEFAERY